MRWRLQLAIAALALAGAIALSHGPISLAPGWERALLAAIGLVLLARGARAAGFLTLSAADERRPLPALAASSRGILLPRRAGGADSSARQSLCDLGLFAGLAGACATLAAPEGTRIAVGLGAAALVALGVTLFLRPGAALRAFRSLAQRFPGHVPPSFANGVDALLRDLRPSRSVAAISFSALATASAWGLELLAARAALRAFGADIGLAEAGLVVVATHAGVALAPALAGLGIAELLALGALSFTSAAGSPVLPGVLALHALLASSSVGVGRLAAPRSSPPDPAAALAAVQRAASERRTRAAAFVERYAKGSDPWLSVVMPAYNESRRITPTLLSALLYLRDRRAPCEIVVVDDGSSDDTGRVVEEVAAEHSQVRLHTLPRNMGKGAAVRAGVEVARGAWILLDDADGATPITELERLLDAAAQGADVAIGSRALPAPDVGIERRLLRAASGRAFAFLVNLLVVPGIADTQCGFKLFRREAADWIFPRQRLDGFAFDVEVLHLARLGGFRIAEVPVNWMNVAGSKVGLLRGLRAFVDTARVRGLHRSSDAPPAPPRR